MDLARGVLTRRTALVLCPAEKLQRTTKLMPKLKPFKNQCLCCVYSAINPQCLECVREAVVPGGSRSTWGVIALIFSLCFVPFTWSYSLNDVHSPEGRSFRTKALGSFPEVQQLHHKCWTFREGAPAGINDIAQTNDGYLWLGTQRGLFRFDGINFELYRPPSGDQLLSLQVRTLYAAKTGGLWIGYIGGISFLKSGVLKHFRDEMSLSSSTVLSFTEDQAGNLWVGTSSGILRFDGQRWERIGKNWNLPGGPVETLAFDRGGNLWVLQPSALSYLPPASHRFELAERNPSLEWLASQADGTVLLAKSPSHSPPAIPLPLGGSVAGGIVMVDSHGGVWSQSKSGEKVWTPPAGSSGTGVRIHIARPCAVLQDRESNVWFADEVGIHRFYYSPLVQQKIKGATLDFMVAEDATGSIWIGDYTDRRIYRIQGGEAKLMPRGANVTCLHAALDGTIWFGTQIDGLIHFSSGRFTLVKAPQELTGLIPTVVAMASEPDGALWVAFGRDGLYRLSHNQWTLLGGRSDVPRLTVVSLFRDGTGRLWIGSFNNRVITMERDHVQVFGPDDGVAVGNVLTIQGGKENIWVGGEFGLQIFRSGRFHSIHAVDENYLHGISGLVQARNGDLWVNGASGIFHIPASELAKALQDSNYKTEGECFGPGDGLPGYAASFWPRPSTAETRDGRIWFALSNGVVWIDPPKEQSRASTPAVSIDSVYADETSLDPDKALDLKGGTSSVQLKFNAVSLSHPEAIRFRYRLRELDRDWQEERTARQVTYRHLSPGTYHFEVNASNSNGSWTNQITTLQFTIQPLFYQTRWFTGLCVITLVLMAGALHYLRLRYVERQLNLGLEARVNERLRIARELHDTLLQSFHGLLLRFQAVSNLLPARPVKAKTELDGVIGQVSTAIGEGRAAVKDLRSSTIVTNDLASEIRMLASELSTHPNGQILPEFALQVEGPPQNLQPIVRDEVYRIAAEALRNAFRHSKARRIEVQIRCCEQELRLQIQDDGKGIDAAILAQHLREGHWGLHGISERAKLLGVNLEIWSQVGSGTEIELVVPASVAYPEQRAWRQILFPSIGINHLRRVREQ